MPIESTYRLQFHKDFTFADATHIVPYLAKLGVTHLYASPYMKAVPGSTHGYDVIDPCQLNPEIGTRADYDALLSAIQTNGMAHILDIVPNHMGVSTNENEWWNDILKFGRASKHAKAFDIAFEDCARPAMNGKVLLPVLGGAYGDVLAKGELKLKRDGDNLFVYYYDRRFPIDPATSKAIDVDATNRTPDGLHKLLEQQHYRLASWRTASDEINYRRFFNVDSLAALRMERQDVFDATHKFIFELVNGGKIAGLRVDHPDGLYDPQQYLQRLQDAYTGKKPLYVAVEKILAEGEPLPKDWPVAGTSGYDFLIAANSLYVDQANEKAFTQLYTDFTGDATPFAEFVYRNKKRMLAESFGGDLNALTAVADAVAQGGLSTRDFTVHELHDALAELIACFAVYRTYIRSEEFTPEDRKQIEAATTAARQRALHIQPAAFDFLRDALLQRDVGSPDKQLRLKLVGKFQQLTSPVTAKGIEDTSFYQYHRLISINEVGGDPGRFGSTPDALHAYLRERQERYPHALSPLSTHDTKRSEDVRARINVLSEIPNQWADALRTFATLTDPFRTVVDGTPAPGRPEQSLILQTLLGACPVDGASDQEQAKFIERVQAYLLKALREAKLRTAWTDPNADYEAAIKKYVEQLFDASAGEAFRTAIEPLRRRVTDFGFVNSLSQTVLRLTAPGAPDTYQGTELWDFSLVDPDNRRPVDYASRGALLDQLPSQADRGPLARELFAARADGRIKLWVTTILLQARREHLGLFSDGQYLPVTVTGEHAGRVFAFARSTVTGGAVVIVPRLLAGLGKSVTDFSWGDTTVVLPDRFVRAELRDLFTGRLVEPSEQGVDVTLPLSEVLVDLPFVVLVLGR